MRNQGITAAIVAIGLLGLLGLFSASSAFAADGPSGIEVGLRSGYALALGDQQQGTKMSDFVSGAIPLWVDLGYRFADPSLFIGVYGEYGFGFASGNSDSVCKDVLSGNCSSHVLMYGVQAQYHPLPKLPFEPWIGIGTGGETISLSGSSGGNASATYTLSGWDYLTAQVGVDYRDSPKNVGIGLFGMLGVGEYGSYSTGGNVLGVSAATSGSVANKSTHEWLTLGLRGVFDIHL